MSGNSLEAFCLNTLGSILILFLIAHAFCVMVGKPKAIPNLGKKLLGSLVDAAIYLVQQFFRLCWHLIAAPFVGLGMVIEHYRHRAAPPPPAGPRPAPRRRRVHP